jgi:hypothetical protein
MGKMKDIAIELDEAERKQFLLNVLPHKTARELQDKDDAVPTVWEQIFVLFWNAMAALGLASAVIVLLVTLSYYSK